MTRYLTPAHALLACVALLCDAAFAESWGVQIAAVSTPEPGTLDAAARVGTIYTRPGPGGLTRYRVGPFPTEALALRARDTLRQLGYRDAFVKVEQGPARPPTALDEPASPAAASASASIAAGDIPPGLLRKKDSLSPEEVAYLGSLSPEQRARLVYLDGRLHLKVGDDLVEVVAE